MSEVKSSFVRCEKQGRLGIVLLDRPKALNALDVGMVRAIGGFMRELTAADDVDAIVLRSTSERAFCAGGDMRALGSLPTPDERMAECRDFFTSEYSLNLFMHRCAKPIVSLIDGVAMGGGIGISVFGAYRVVSERARLAMPEVALGLYPDVGGAWFLNRCPGMVGRYLALTGTISGSADALFSGLATHHVPASGFDELVDAFSREPAITRDAIDRLLSRHGADAGPSDLSERRAAIDRVFAADRLEEVIDRLADEGRAGAQWAMLAAQAMAKASPTSLRATWRRLGTSPGAALKDVLAEDFRMSVRLVATDDFAEGVRAVLVDKDQNPRWSPRTIVDVPESLIDGLLAPLADEPDLDGGSANRR